jgi:hypothetical protein
MSYFNSSISDFVVVDNGLRCTIGFGSRAISEATVTAYGDGRVQVLLDFGDGKTYQSFPYVPGEKTDFGAQRWIRRELVHNIGETPPINEIMELIDLVQDQLMAAISQAAAEERELTMRKSVLVVAAIGTLLGALIGGFITAMATWAAEEMRRAGERVRL